MSQFADSFEKAFPRLVFESEKMSPRVCASIIETAEGLYTGWVEVFLKLTFRMDAVLASRRGYDDHTKRIVHIPEIHLRTHVRGPDLRMVLTDDSVRSKHYSGVDANYIVFRILSGTSEGKFKEYTGFIKGFAEAVGSRFLREYLTSKFGPGIQEQLSVLKPTPKSLSKAQLQMSRKQ